jgi:hypothetical protein
MKATVNQAKTVTSVVSSTPTNSSHTRMTAVGSTAVLENSSQQRQWLQRSQQPLMETTAFQQAPTVGNGMEFNHQQYQQLDAEQQLFLDEHGNVQTETMPMEDATVVMQPMPTITEEQLLFQQQQMETPLQPPEFLLESAQIAPEQLLAFQQQPPNGDDHNITAPKPPGSDTTRRKRNVFLS